MTVTGATDLAFLGWLAAAVLASWLAPPRWRSEALVVTTAAFLAAVDPISLGLLAGFTAAVLVATFRRGPGRGAWILAAMAAIVAALFAFKALDAGRSLVIPLGLSFYALRCLHVLAESYLDEIPPPPPRQLVAYLFFLPTIVAGPVHRYPAFTAEATGRVDWPRVSLALERMLYGYVAIVVVSNYLLRAKAFPWLKAHVDPAGAAYQYLDCLDFGLNLYFQFAGYSEIAIAAALLVGHTVVENFDRPLLRTNLVDFWRSWHMSVTSWCREYVFTGVFALTRQRWLGLVATMLTVGVWHGLSLNFVAWGLYHGVGLVATQAWSTTVLQRRRYSGAGRWLLAAGGWLFTFHFVMLGFVWTKEPSLNASLAAFRVLLIGGGR